MIASIFSKFDVDRSPTLRSRVYKIAPETGRGNVLYLATKVHEILCRNGAV